MESLPDIEHAASDLAEVIGAGLLSDLKASVAFNLRNRPRSDYDAHPGLKQSVDDFGGLLYEFTGLPLQLCRLAALNQLLPSNRTAAALDTLRAFADDIRANRNRDRASTIIAAERRRRAS